MVLQTSYENDSVLFFRQMKELALSRKLSSELAVDIRCTTLKSLWVPKILKVLSMSILPSTDESEGRAWH